MSTFAITRLETQIRLTEWGRAVRVIHCLEETFRERVHLEEMAPITHEILLVGDVFNPLAVVRVRCRPKRHLVGLASQVHKRYRKTGLASALQLDRDYGRVRLGALATGGAVIVAR